MNNTLKLTPYQAIFYYEWLQDPLRSDYNIVMDSIVTGDLDIARCEDSMIKVLNDHFAFCYNPASNEDGLFWVSRKPTDKLLVYHPDQLTYDQIYSIVSEPFDLEKDLLLRLHVIKLSGLRYRILVIVSHLVIDGFKTQEIYEKWAGNYNHNEYRMIPLQEQVVLHRELNNTFDRIMDGNKQAIHGFWRKHMDGLSGVDLTFLKNNKAPVAKQARRNIGEYVFSYDEAATARIKSLRHYFGITPYIYGQLILAVLLNKITGQKAIGVTYPIAVMEGADLFYAAHVNSLIIDYRFDKDTTTGSLIAQALSFFKELKQTKAKYLPIQEIIQYADNDGMMDIAFAQTYLRDHFVAFDGITVEKVNHELQIDLVNKLLFEQEQHGNHINYRVKYDLDILDEGLVTHFISMYRKLMDDVLDDLAVNNGNEKVSSYRLLDKSALKVFSDWNDTRKPYAEDKTITWLFEEQVRKNPGHTALICKDVRLTYGELNERANRLAYYLIDAYDLHPDDLVVMCMDRSEHMLVSILGILKAGAAYVPVEPTMPDERIAYMISDTQARAVLCNKDHSVRMNMLHPGVEVVDDPAFLKKVSCCSSHIPQTLTGPGHLAYVTYTSGTTGNPKGVMVEHRSVSRLVINTDYITVDTDDVFLSLSGYQFDGSVYDFFAPLLNGAALVLPEKEIILDMNELDALIKENRVTNFFITTSLFNSIVDADLRSLENMRYLLFGGEVASLNHVFRFRKNYRNVRLLNVYGPTETTTYATGYRIDEPVFETVPIGYPISNTTTYILDEHLQPLPVGAIGELYIGGAGVARGYLNNPGLTAEKFLVNPFQSEEEKRDDYNGYIYKTGDLVRYAPGGEILYVGRNDFQVKIRGFRVELGEIETSMVRYPGIKQSLVLAKNHVSGTKYLVGYYIADKKLDDQDIRRYMERNVPDFMVPSFLIHLDKFPLNVNGKIDRKALPEPVFADSHHYIAPKNKLEEDLCRIYAEMLGLDPASVSMEDDFYKLGGNSILAIRLAGRINNTLEKNIHVSNLFTYKTIRQLSTYMLQGDENTVHITGSNVSEPEDQLLSFAQERLWFIESFEEGSNVYNVPMIFRIKENTGIGCLIESLHMIVHRHEVLRSLIHTNKEGVGYQVVSDDTEKPLNIERQSVRSEAELNEAISKSINRIFRLDSEYPIHVKLYTLDQHNYISIVVHHIAFDGWSVGIFIKELLDHYQYLQAGSSEPLPAIPVQYRDFALWQREFLTGDTLKPQIDYWKEQLSGYENLNLPTDKTRPSQVSYAGADITFGLDEPVSEGLKQLAKDLNVSIYSLLLSGYYMLLSAYSGQKDIVVGTPIAGRHYQEITDTIGFFVNTLALRQLVDPGQTVAGLITQVGKHIDEVQKNQDMPFEKLVDELQVTKDTSRHPVIQVMFGVQSFGSEQKEVLDELLEYIDAVDYDYHVAKFDLTTMMDDSGERITGVFNYATALFSDETIHRYIATYTLLLKQLSELGVEGAGRKMVGELHLLDSADYQQVVFQWNRTRKPYFPEYTINQLFERQVMKNPDQIALIYKDTKLTYRNLNDRANLLAGHLINTYHFCPDDLVGVCMGRSEYMLITIMGILKAGAAYVPMDPSMPDERIKFMLLNAGARIMITDCDNRQRMVPLHPEVVVVDDAAFSNTQARDFIFNPETDTRSGHLAYVMYTSGTTGNPKGVMITHESVNRLVMNTNYVRIDETDRVLSLSGYQFDGSVYDFFAPLLNGATLVMSDKETFLDLDELNALIERNEVTNFFITTALFNSITDAGLPALEKLKCIIFGGEAASTQHVLKFRKMFGNVQLMNAYGPTETTTFATTYTVSSDSDILPIGCPINNTSVYVLDSSMRPLPAGAVGELYIGGAGVARGYLNNKELTSERFLPNPFRSDEEKQDHYNAYIYKTGDLVKYQPNGCIIYLGRNDFQVKIRGFRIELGEIETKLASYPGISQAIVLARDHSSGIKYLIGYYVSETAIDESRIQEYIGRSLPDFMVPSVFVHLQVLPLTLNGKVDHKALPLPEFTGTRDYVAPGTEAEEQLCRIYGEVLGIASGQISVEDDFFKLGGDSISSIQLVNRIRQHAGIHLSIKDIFRYRTIRSLYLGVIAHAKDGINIRSVHTEQGLITGDAGMLPIQEWFFSNMDKGLIPAYNHWNQSFLVRTPVLDRTVLQWSIGKLVEYHNEFRLAFRKTGNGILQYYQETAPGYMLDYIDIRGLSGQQVEDVMTGWQSGFDIFGGKLFHIGYMEGFGDSGARIHVALHHLIVDAVSWRIIKNDLQAIYQYGIEHAGEGVSIDDIPAHTILGNKGSSYRQWADAISHYLEDEPDKRNRELAYWESIAADVPVYNRLLEKLTDPQHSEMQLELDARATKSLLKGIHNVYRTRINDVLLAALSQVLTEFTGIPYHHILLEGHGRENVIPDMDITNTTGWFTCMYPVRLATSGNAPALAEVKDMMRQIPANGIGYGALIGYIEKELPVITFNYLGQFDSYTKDDRQWQFINDSSGVAMAKENKDNNILNISGGVIDGKLRFYVSGYLNPDRLNHFAGIFKDGLLSMISSLSGEKRSYLTLSDVNFMVSQPYLNHIQESREVDAVYLANSLQQGFIYHALTQGGKDDAYKVQFSWDYHNQLDADRMERAWMAAQERYPALRLRFSWDEDLVQVIDRKGTLNWTFKDLSDMLPAAQDEFIDELIRKDRTYEFDLQDGRLFRVYLIRRSDNRYTCLFSNHHAILDGWSLPVMINNVHQNYLKLVRGETVPAGQDLTYSLSQQYLYRNRFENNCFWDEYIQQLQSQEDLAALLKPSKKHIRLSDYKHIEESVDMSFVIGSARYELIKKLCAGNGFTLNALLQYCWHRQLSLYGNTDTTVVGMTVSGRNMPVEGIESSVGLFINTLPVIMSHGDMSVMDAVKILQDSINEVNSHSDVNLARLQKDGVRLFNTLFVFENYPVPQDDEPGGLVLKFRYAKEKLDYPLGVSIHEKDGEVSFKIQYAGELFEEETIRQLMDDVSGILDQLTSNHHIRTTELKHMDKAGYRKVVRDWNRTVHPYPSDKTIIQLFEDQAEKTPDNDAVVYRDVRLTYRELNERANMLAAYLRETYRIGADNLVALCMDRSELMLIAMLGVLKSGAAYVPVDPDAPDERVRFMVADTQAKTVLCDGNQVNRLNVIPGLHTDVIDDDGFWSRIGNYPVSNPGFSVHPSDLAYVIYTSGTTGKPKGVMLEHRGVVNLAVAMARQFGLDNRCDVKCLWYASYVFDAHVFELYKVITSGNCIYIAGEEVRRDFSLLVRYISENGIKVATLPPVLLDKECIPDLDLLVVAGEVTNPEIMEYYHCHGIQVINAYGPTEDTVCSTLHQYRTGDDNTNIGSPVANTTVYVLDRNMQPVPAGAVGELYVGGEGIARGYLNNRELSGERFLSNPFQTGAEKQAGYNGRIYRTGDLVRFYPDGNLEYIGRNDFQVKIRGFRIELGEIESCMSAYPGIRQSVILAREHSSGVKYLVGYYVCDTDPDISSIQEHLKNELPEYMVPSALVRLDKLPVTVNGKLDRKALPDPGITDRSYEPPRDEAEGQLCSVFGNLLGIEPANVSIDDDFFRLGGNSILAIKLNNRINEIFGKQLPVMVVSEHKTIRSLALRLKQDNHDVVKVRPVMVADPQEQVLSFAQERIWFIESFEGGSDVYNIPIVLEVKENAYVDCLVKAIRTVVCRHEILRTQIRTTDDGTGYQAIIDDSLRPLPVEKLEVWSDEELDRAIREVAGRPFNLESGYPVRVALYSCHKSVYMAIVVHHIAFDGWSVDLFMKEVLNFYHYEEAMKEGRADEAQAYLLPGLDAQYRDYALWQRQYLTGDVLKQQQDYWAGYLSGYETLHLPVDKPRPLYAGYEGEDIEFRLDDVTSTLLRLVARELGVSLYSVLLSGYYLLLSSFSNQKDIVVGTPVAGRNYDGIENMIGLFINVLVLRQQIISQQSLRDFITGVGQSVNEAQKNQDLPFEKLVDVIHVDKDISRHPVFQVMFGLQSFGKEYASGFEKLFRPYPYENKVAKFDLTVMMDDSGECISGTFNYATTLFNRSTIKNYISVYMQILEQLAIFATSQTRVGQVNYLPDSQYRMVIEEWNHTPEPYASGTTISQLFEEQVERTPDCTAIISGDVHLTYRELNERAGSLAAYLVNIYKIRPDDLIPVCLDRSEYMMIAIHAVLKAGAAYVPVDPGIPGDRIAYIIQDTEARVVLSVEAWKDKLEECTGVTIELLDNRVFEEHLKAGYPEAQVTSGAGPHNLAYVIYTSGTTGNPKGVMIEHGSVVNRIQWMNNHYPLLPDDRILQKTTYTFDVSVWELFWANWYGACIVLAHPRDYKDNLYLADVIRKENITIMHFVPSMLAAFEETLSDNPRLKDEVTSLRYLFCSGEALGINEVKKFHELVPACGIHNLYGPTETTVDVLYYDCTDRDISTVMIGRPVANTSAYVLNDSLQPVPVGAIGELYIGGVNVGRGYANNPELTARSFLKNPFQTEEERDRGYNGRIYKTGDLVKYHPDGNIEYIGRNDFQVKIRGFRIELGEIESCLATVPGVKQAVVAAREHVSGNRYLVGYYVSEQELDSGMIRTRLGEELPEYMVPPVFVHMAGLPLTANGKLDRKALPDPEFTGRNAYVAPGNETEMLLCRIYGEVLGLDPSAISIEDDFYQLGGNSILAIRLIHRINQSLNDSASLVDVLGAKSIRGLAGICRDKTYQPVVELNQSAGKDILFMVHPGIGGCDVYFPLAEELGSCYHCYGIDSYNRYHSGMIDDLGRLAGYYLDQMDQALGPQPFYRLLGWSLGGQIALEIATVLESRGVKDITVYLLDTWMTEIREAEPEDFTSLMRRFNIPETQMDMIIRIAEADHTLSAQSLSSKLQYARILLFKAVEGIDEKYNRLYPYNHIDNSLESTGQITAVNVKSSHHSILEHSREIAGRISEDDCVPDSKHKIHQ